MRAVRRRITAHVSQGAVRCAPWLSEGTIDAAERAAGWLGPRFPVMSRIVAENMRAAGVYTPERHREYFRQVAGQLAAWMHIFRQPERCSRNAPNGMSSELARIVEDRIRLDESVALLKEAASAGKGVVLTAMHIANVPMLLARMNQAIPTTVLARYSKDPRRRRIKEQWWRATAIGYVALSSRSGKRGARLAKMADVLQEGRVVAVAADMPRKRGEGMAVRFFGRQIHLPTGAAVLSVKTGAPLMMLTARPVGHAKCLTFHGPFVPEPARRAQGSQQDAVAERLQWFADGFEAFLRTHAPLWFFWGDKRWTRVFQGDPRYVRPLDGRELGAAAAGCDQGGR